jgi:hypothetical protein
VEVESLVADEFFRLNFVRKAAIVASKPTKLKLGRRLLRVVGDDEGLLSLAGGGTTSEARLLALVFFRMIGTSSNLC